MHSFPPSETSQNETLLGILTVSPLVGLQGPGPANCSLLLCTINTRQPVPHTLLLCVPVPPLLWDHHTLLLGWFSKVRWESQPQGDG